MEVLHRKGSKHAAEVLRAHRDGHVTKADFQRIKSLGLNAVRLPFGYWCLLGPAAGEPYVGPCVEYIDRAVDWAEEFGLQIVLDLHGCPGGESGEAPCGHRQRPDGTWTWRQWNVRKSLEAVEYIAKRYAGRSCVTGVAVCNEPSNEIPLTRLLKYYSDACDVVRKSGMHSSEVAVVLPCFQRDEEVVISKWEAMTGGRHRNICFDVHCYHCFENEFQGKSFAQQLRAVEANGEMLRRHPMVVGEWSLALGCTTWNTCGKMSDDAVYRRFAAAQQIAFREASHGSFFWNWSEGPDREWNFQLATDERLLEAAAPGMPAHTGAGVDPLEQELNPCDGDPCIRYGDVVYIRVFHGRYMDIVGSQVAARWPDKGEWQEVTFCRAAGLAKGNKEASRPEIRDQDVVRLRSRNGRYITVSAKGEVSAQKKGTDKAAEFLLHVRHQAGLSHNSVFFLQSRSSSRNVLAADEDEEFLQARWQDFGWWQHMVAEKAPVAEQTAQSPVAKTPRRGSARELAARATPASKTKPGKRRASAKAASPRKRARPA